MPCWRGGCVRTENHWPNGDKSVASDFDDSFLDRCIVCGRNLGRQDSMGNLPSARREEFASSPSRQPRNRDFGHSSARFIMIIMIIIIGNHGQVSSSLLGDTTVATAE
jgi:hypothetical protein